MSLGVKRSHNGFVRFWLQVKLLGKVVSPNT